MAIKPSAVANNLITQYTRSIWSIEKSNTSHYLLGVCGYNDNGVIDDVTIPDKELNRGDDDVIVISNVVCVTDWSVEAIVDIFDTVDKEDFVIVIIIDDTEDNSTASQNLITTKLVSKWLKFP